MSTSPRVGVALPRAGERAAISDWLRAAGFEPVVLVDACFVQTEVSGQPPVMVIADAALLAPAFIAGLRKGDPNRPVLAIGDGGDTNTAHFARKNIAFHQRPIDEPSLLLAVSLAQAESRLARRSERKSVRVPTMIDGSSAMLVDVSKEGLRLEVDAKHGAKLSPQFVVQVPVLRMAVPVQRVWVRSAASAERKVQCGGTLLAHDERTLRAWERLTDPSAPRVYTEKLASAKVTPDGLFGRVSSIISHAPIVGSLAHLPWKR
jgi:hypothetical protein